MGPRSSPRALADVGVVGWFGDVLVSFPFFLAAQKTTSAPRIGAWRHPAWGRRLPLGPLPPLSWASPSGTRSDMRADGKDGRP